MSWKISHKILLLALLHQFNCILDFSPDFKKEAHQQTLAKTHCQLLCNWKYPVCYISSQYILS